MSLLTFKGFELLQNNKLPLVQGRSNGAKGAGQNFSKIRTGVYVADFGKRIKTDLKGMRRIHVVISIDVSLIKHERY